MRARAVAAAVAVGTAHGLRVDEPRVLHDGSNTLVHLWPSPVVARVATTVAAVRPGTTWLAREVRVAGWLAAAGAPVVPPAAGLPPGPHVQDGLALSLWTHVETVPAPEDLAPAGAALRTCHRLLAGSGLALPAAGTIEETCRLVGDLLVRSPRAFDAAEWELLGWWAERLPAVLARRLPERAPIHGDAHPGNVLHTAAGPLWNDWEDCFQGPPAWDLACMLAGARVFGSVAPAAEASFLAGYGDPGVDDESLGLLVDARVLQAPVWGTILAARRGQRRSPVVTAALAWLRARRG